MYVCMYIYIQTHMCVGMCVWVSVRAGESQAVGRTCYVGVRVYVCTHIYVWGCVWGGVCA